MGYVMVPVPEEHVEEVMRAILRFQAQARTEPWDEASVKDLFADSDEAAKAVLSVVARGVISSGKIADQDVASAIEISGREVLGIVRELNELSVDLARPAIIHSRTETEVLPNGRMTERRVLFMTTESAVSIRDAERAELQSSPTGVPSGNG